MTRYRRGCLSKKATNWVFRFYVVRPSDGKRVENTKVIGAIRQMNKTGAWAEVERLGLTALMNTPHATKVTVAYLANHYKQHGLERKGLTGQKDPGTVWNYRHILDDYIVPRWGERLACELRPLEVEEWLESLFEDEALQWPTIDKIRRVMSLTFKEGRRHQIIDRQCDPMALVRCACSSDYEARTVTAEQTLAILYNLELEERIPTILIAATGIRISEALGLRWSDIEYGNHRIRIRRRWSRGRIGPPKTRSSRGSVPMHPVLAQVMEYWQQETPYNRADDWVFASRKLHGEKPRTGNMISQDYLRPAAVEAGVIGADEKVRFGFHNLRHSLATYLVEREHDPKTVQALLRHSNIRTTLGLYAHANDSKKLQAQGQYLSDVLRGGLADVLRPASESVN